MNKRIRSIPFLKWLLLLLLLCGQLMAGSLTVQAVEEGPEIPEASEQSEATEFPVPSDLPDTLTVKTGFSNTGLDE